MEQVEAAVAAIKSVRGSLQRGAPGILAGLPRVLSSLEALLPQVRRHRGSKEVQATLRALRLETRGLIADAARLAKSLDLPAPGSIDEANRVLAPHLPLRMNSRVIAKPFELAIVLAAPVLWLGAFWARLPAGAAPVVPIFLALWGGYLAFFFFRSVRVLLTAQVLRLGRREFPLAEIRSVHFELPGWLSRRGERATVTVETRFGLNATIKMPNALGPLMKALRQSGVQVVQTGGLW